MKHEKHNASWHKRGQEEHRKQSEQHKNGSVHKQSQDHATVYEKDETEETE